MANGNLHWIANSSGASRTTFCATYTSEVSIGAWSCPWLSCAALMPWIAPASPEAPNL